LPLVDADCLFEGALCNAVSPSDGMWYEANVEKVLTAEEAEAFAAADLRSNMRRFQVKYKAFNTKMTVPLDYLRITGEQASQNTKKK
jgi:hypothetical protein